MLLPPALLNISIGAPLGQVRKVALLSVVSLLALQMLSHVVRQSDTALQVLVVAKSLLGDVAAHREQVPARRCQFSLRAVRLSRHLLIKQMKNSRDFRSSTPA